ncbi:MAG: hypothetical protein ACXWIU_14725 [Limisphaerales bacterium]
MFKRLLFAFLVAATFLSNAATPTTNIVGMYIHQHWPYNHPYCARTWTIEDWRGYCGGLKKLGYNSILIWPVLETMPDPLTSSDKANLKKISKVIDVLHDELHMRVFICLCPNVGTDDVVASKLPFEKRHFFYCDTRINPADAQAMEKLMRWREKLMRPLRKADGVAIIDSDPGGYPGSSNQEFVNLLAAHRKMLDHLRPGIELIYWMHTGWEAYGRLYSTGKFANGSDAEHLDCLRRLKDLNPEPWGVANGYVYAKELGIADKVISFNYGRIEGEPSFPLTNFGPEQTHRAYEGGQLPGPRGVMGNAQTHCIQLPNTFAFVRGALGKPVADSDYVQFADDLIVGHGHEIVAGWKALRSNDPLEMSRAADDLEALNKSKLKTGSLRGLLFGDAHRFLNDLVLMLRYKGALQAFANASEKGRDIKKPLEQFVAATETWQHTHGYENAWSLGPARNALLKLNDPQINQCLSESNFQAADNDPDPNASPYDRVRGNLARTESFVPRLLKAMRSAADSMK